MTISLPRSLTLAAMTVVGMASGGCGDVNRALEDVHEARHLAADLLVQFTKAADASNLAVMANTDAASMAFAKEVETRTATVQKDVDALKPVLEKLDFAEESRLLADFQARFDEYRKLDRSVLALAVENTNLKAQQLSYGASREAADAVTSALAGIEPSGDSKEGWHVKALAFDVMARTREIEALQAPHIAAPDDPTMTSLETRMSATETAARASLKTLFGLVHPASRAKVTAASAALDRLVDLNQQIIELSRRNTNVRSLALSLTEKRPLVAACEQQLHALQAALAKRGFGSPARFPRPGSPSGNAP
jgi:Four helix bundle sensory module for signal transduction